MLICPPFQFPAIFVCTFCMLSAYQTIHTGEYKFVRSVVAAPNLADTLCSGMGNVLFCVLRVHILECATAHFYSKESLEVDSLAFGRYSPSSNDSASHFSFGVAFVWVAFAFTFQSGRGCNVHPCFRGTSRCYFFNCVVHLRTLHRPVFN